MIHIRVRNVNEALVAGTRFLSKRGTLVQSRNGPTLEAKEPVCTMYEKPRERVLFSTARDANPFFHLMESLWILAGRRDVKWLEYFNANMATYSDDGKVFHGAYGYRMRNHFGAGSIDQLIEVISLLRDERGTRRASIALWDPYDDLNVDRKDLPCNGWITFLERDGLLNMTVYNRSNDMIWGAYGANVVHFSILQEFIASAIGAGVGTYHQVSNSFHVYTETQQWTVILAEKETVLGDLYQSSGASPYPLVSVAWDQWLKELNAFMRQTDQGFVDLDAYKDPFFINVACPMFQAWNERKSYFNQSRFEATTRAIEIIEGMADCDWKVACDQWLTRRWEKLINEQKS